MKCTCGHTHEGKCEECGCLEFKRDPDWEPPDAPGWEGGFADNH